MNIDFNVHFFLDYIILKYIYSDFIIKKLFKNVC